MIAFSSQRTGDKMVESAYEGKMLAQSQHAPRSTKRGPAGRQQVTATQSQVHTDAGKTDETYPLLIKLIIFQNT